ncbi:hypothetical protein [Chryseobacterium polytrichastri]|uniref:Uncharacterized protein n=1 Tax=Chryseobacterium polytrichastri TaxID=1302687 RepID=A0A1M7AEA1_9FLAO|nr:hypothetical protein [Chryseobacterium polytrichastri]SHL41123.1 hypothetical protein SAMN05444267_101766 [Chryseobacterium polytrichastri]
MKSFCSILCIFFYALLLSQNNKLQQYRNSYCLKNCSKYKKEQKWITDKNPPPAPQRGVYPVFKQAFSIPLNVRKTIYPFDNYDTMYVVSPNFVTETNEPRNYLENKFHNKTRIITSAELDKLSDILFNYYLFNDIYRTGFTSNESYKCIQDSFPSIILLFMRKGKFEKYIAFPDKGKDRYNFTDNEYSNFDMSKDKEKKILELFKHDITPYKCN